MLRAYGRLLAFLLLALGAAFLMPSLAFGHADYDRSVPNADEVVATPPTQVDVFFTGIVTKFKNDGIRFGSLAMASVALIGSTAFMLTLPKIFQA